MLSSCPDAEMPPSSSVDWILHRVFGVPLETLRDLVQESFVHDWQSDPNCRGAYSYALADGKEAARGLCRRFAGFEGAEVLGAKEFRSHGGNDSEANLITLCFACHSRLYRG